VDAVERGFARRLCWYRNQGGGEFFSPVRQLGLWVNTLTPTPDPCPLNPQPWTCTLRLANSTMHPDPRRENRNPSCWNHNPVPWLL